MSDIVATYLVFGVIFGFIVRIVGGPAPILVWLAFIICWPLLLLIFILQKFSEIEI